MPARLCMMRPESIAGMARSYRLKYPVACRGAAYSSCITHLRDPTPASTLQIRLRERA